MDNRALQEQQERQLARLEQRAKEFQQKYEEMIESFAVASLPMQRQAFQCCVHCFDSCCGSIGEGGMQPQVDDTKNRMSASTGWSRLFGRGGGETAAANSSPPFASDLPQSLGGRFDARKGEKVHEKVTRCVSRCHEKGENISRVVQQELDVLQSKLESCQKVCYSRLADERQQAAGGKGSGGEAQQQLSAQGEQCFMQCFTDAEPLMKEISYRLHKRIKESI